MEPELIVKIPKMDDDYLSCANKVVKKEDMVEEYEEVCAEKAAAKCVANEYPSTKADMPIEVVALCPGGKEKQIAKAVQQCREEKKTKEAAKPKKPRAEATSEFPAAGKNASFRTTLWEKLKSFLRAKPNCPVDKMHGPICDVPYSAAKHSPCKESPRCEDKCRKKPAAPKKPTTDETTSANDVTHEIRVTEVCIAAAEDDSPNVRESLDPGECINTTKCPQFRLPNCPPRVVCSCDVRSEFPKCTVVETPYVSFSECHVFKKLKLNEKQIADLRARMTKKTFREMQQRRTEKRSFSTSALGRRNCSGKARNAFDVFEGITEESVQEMDDLQLAEKIMDCIKDGLDTLEKEHPMYEVYKELELITMEELKQCERYLDVRDKTKKPDDDEMRDYVTYSCRFE